MSENLQIAIIGGLLTAIPTILTIIASNKKTTALLEYRLSQLEEKVNKHNQVIERTYKLEKNESVIEERLKVVEREIKEIKK